MTEVKRYRADRVPVKWDGGVGEVQEVVLASDYDALLAQARRLREAWLNQECDITGRLKLDLAYLEVKL
jgi:hypothetical protein